MIPLSVFAGGEVQTSLDVDGVSTWDVAGVFVSRRAATEAEAAQLAAFLAAQEAEQVRTLQATADASLSGSGPPANSLGRDGDTYIDVNSNFAYGPKVAGAWPVGAYVALGRT